MKHVKLLLALIVVLLAGLAASEMAMAQGKKKSTSKIPVKTEKPAAKRTPQPKQEKKPAAKPRQEKKREAKPQPKAEPKPQPKAEPKKPKRSADEIINAYVNSMVYVEGGTFTMGATSEQGGDAYDAEKPAHSVTLSSYHIGQTEVTQELWEAVMGSNPSSFKGSNRPVECVS